MSLMSDQDCVLRSIPPIRVERPYTANSAGEGLSLPFQGESRLQRHPAASGVVPLTHRRLNHLPPSMDPGMCKWMATTHRQQVN